MSAFLHGRGAPDGEGASGSRRIRSSLWFLACFLLAGRSRIPERAAKAFLKPTVHFVLDQEGYGLRE
jgi:hypothetical protein